MTEYCSDQEMTELMQKVEADTGVDVTAIDKLLEEYPEDPRLYFLRGSVLAGSEHLVEAHESMKKAVDLAPEFHIARFQLGFFQLSSGEAQAALATWKPLENLPEQHYLSRFVAGLTYLIQDEFELAVNNLRAGQAGNQENPPLNNDMQLIIDKCVDILSQNDVDAGEEESISSTSLLLNQFSKPN